jgi:uncharacterized membrane protein YfcA
MRDLRSWAETATGVAALAGSAVGAALGFTGVIDETTIMSVILALLVAFLGYQMLHNSSMSGEVSVLSAC